MSAYVAKHLQGRQSDWSAATQDRLAMMTAILGGIKSMKILGLEKATTCLVLNLRAQEIAMSLRLRWLMVAYNASGKALLPQKDEDFMVIGVILRALKLITGQNL